MMRLITAVALTAALSATAIAQGKSNTAPGQTGKTPGQQQQATPNTTGKDFAPGQNQKEPGGAKDLAPGHKK
jgi:hypothetical protein